MSRALLSLSLALPAALACAPLDAARLPPPCREAYNACLSTCEAQMGEHNPRLKRENEQYGRAEEQWVEADASGCVDACNEDAEACAAGKGPPPHRHRPGRAPAPLAQWEARYFGDSNFARECGSGQERDIALQGRPCPRAPQVFTARWTLQRPPAEGPLRLRVETRGSVRALLDGRPLPLAGEGGVLQSEPFEPGKGRGHLVIEYRSTPDATGIRASLQP